MDSAAGLSRNAGKGHSISGDFWDLEYPNPAFNFYIPLEDAWSAGLTDFINFGSTKSAAYYASGGADAGIRATAQAYKTWLNLGGNRKGFLAPLQEMNGNWVSYGCDPTNYKLAYQRIQNIFAQEGVGRNQVWWVYAPNGWSSPCANNAKLRDYYPGDAAVDVIAISAYNWGTCPSNSTWQTPAQVFGPYLGEIRTTVSSAKPIFISQTATSSFGGDKDQWLRDTYQYFENQNVRAAIYYNQDVACAGGGNYNFTIYNPPQLQVGYKDAANLPFTKYIAPGTLATKSLTP